MRTVRRCACLADTNSANSSDPIAIARGGRLHQPRNRPGGHHRSLSLLRDADVLGRMLIYTTWSGAWLIPCRSRLGHNFAEMQTVGSAVFLSCCRCQRSEANSMAHGPRRRTLIPNRRLRRLGLNKKREDEIYGETRG